MSEFKIGEALVEALKNIHQNKGKLIVLYLINLAITLSITYLVYGPIFLRLIQEAIPNISVTSKYFIATTDNFLLIAAFWICVVLYQSHLSVVLVKIFDNTIFDSEMTFFDIIIFGFTKIGHMVLTSFMLLVVILPVVFLITTLTIYIGITSTILFLIVIYACMIFFTFILQGIVVDELSPVEALKTSAQFVKNNFLKVLGLVIVTFVIGFAISFFIGYVSVYMGIAGVFLISIHQYFARIYTNAVLTEFYCQSEDYNKEDTTEECS